MNNGLLTGDDGKCRCWWQKNDPEYQRYHDEEWGRPVEDDQRLFEKICLEGFQAGLSWLTILRKRDNFRQAFDRFNFEKVARFTVRDVERLVQDAGIIRHRGKIESTINNAQKACDLADEYGSLAKYFWKFEPGQDARPQSYDYETISVLVKTPESQSLSQDLKSRGWSFVGPTTVYAFMQAMGMVNDHLHGCVLREDIERLRRDFKRP